MSFETWQDFCRRWKTGIKNGAFRAIAGCLNAGELPGRSTVFNLKVTAELGLHAQGLVTAVASNQKITNVEKNAKKKAFLGQSIEA